VSCPVTVVLYQGIADKARLAGLPKTVLENAQLRSDVLKADTEKKAAAALARRIKLLLSGSDSATGGQSTVMLRHALSLLKTL
jgi:DNA mismatch repair protein MSH3